MKATIHPYLGRLSYGPVIWLAADDTWSFRALGWTPAEELDALAELMGY